MHKEKQLIDVEIDGLTPCLVEKATGETIDTTVEPIKVTKKDYKNWKFNWSIPQKEGYDIYALRIKKSKIIEGLIALEENEGNKGIYINLIESAPHNYGTNGKYKGVGGYLSAFACKKSKEVGFDNIYFEVKTSLIDYYKEKFGAESIMFTNRMYIEGDSFESLIKTYFKEV